MNRTKLLECLELVKQMTADVTGEWPVGLVRVKKLLMDVLDDVPAAADDETVYIGPEPPRGQHDIDGRLRSIFIHRKSK